MKNKTLLTLALSYGLSAAAPAAIVTSGETNIGVDTTKLFTDANLQVTGNAQGTAFNKSGFLIAFAITSGTNFEYNPDPSFSPIGGQFEHFSFGGNDPFIELRRLDDNSLFNVGDFTIGFDGSRSASGFFVKDNLDTGLILFDLDTPSTLTATASPDTFFAEGDLLFSPEFATFLTDEGLASSDLTGDTIGNAQIDAVPEPGTASLLLGAGILFIFNRRRNRSH